MNKDFVTYQGALMIKGWPEKIEAAQMETAYSIDGREVRRVAYGDEGNDWGADQHPCHDCRVIKGQLHVPGCDGEECPLCHGQVISCDCPYDEDNDGN